MSPENLQLAKEIAGSVEAQLILGFLGCITLALLITVIEFSIKGWLDRRREG